MAGLTLVDLTKRYGGATAVSNVSITLNDGELLSLLGPSGCGKTTTLRMIGGFITPDEGDILIDGQSIVRLPPERRPTAMVFQRYALWPHMTVYDNIAFGLQLRNKSREEIRKTVDDALVLTGLPGKEKRYPHQLSGGEAQRVALARALVLEPRILLLDEPLSNLDAQLRLRMRDEIRNIQQRVNITTVFVTHDQEEALAIADRIGVMNGGHLEQLASPDEIYTQPATLFVASFIGNMNLLPGSITDGAVQCGLLGFAIPQDARLSGSTREAIIAVRPEELVLDGHGPYHGQVTQSINLGDHKLLVVDAGEQLVRVAVAREDAVPRGTAVNFSARRYHVYEDGVLRGTAVSNDTA
ncbi:MAG: ABC transporter ATP-binding protein [Chloroflexi bacterium]|nr:ABC transporter ATP-binding protein [Chloroflexota bacterium]